MHTETARAEIVSIEQAKKHIRLEGNFEDDNLRLFINRSHSLIRERVGFAFDTETWRARYYPARDGMYAAPLQITGVSKIICRPVAGDDNEYTDAADYTFSIADRQNDCTGFKWVHDDEELGDICNFDRADGIEFDLTVGTAFADQPDKIKDLVGQAIMLMVGHYFENREATTFAGMTKDIRFGVDELLEPIARFPVA